MVTTTTLLSWKAFEQLPDDGMRHEVIEGELISLPPPKSGHARVAKRAYRALMPLEERGLGQVYVEAGYKLSENPPTWVQPDVSLITSERDRATAAAAYFTGAPELAVEVASPSESAPDMERKVDALLAAGSFAVWVIYPESRKVRVFLRDGISISRGMNDKLTLPELLPGWELPVSKLFEE